MRNTLEREEEVWETRGHPSDERGTKERFEPSRKVCFIVAAVGTEFVCGEMHVEKVDSVLIIRAKNNWAHRRISALKECLTIQGRLCKTDACFHQEGYAAGLAVDNAMKCFISYEDTRSEALAGKEVRFKAQSAGLGGKPRDIDGQKAAPSI